MLLMYWTNVLENEYEFRLDYDHLDMKWFLKIF